MREGDWDNERSEVAHSEARAVIEAQNETMSELDEKAMRTMRFNAIIGGIFVSAYQYQSEAFHTKLTAAAGGFLFVSAALCVATYDESNLYLGPDGEYLSDLANGDIEDGEWEQDLIDVFSGMISINRNDIMFNAWLLKISLLLLIIGVGTGFVSIVI